MMTVGQLLEHAELSCSLVAGATGVDNQIRWAHLSELEDPTLWFRGKELLMTTGMALPEDAALQVAYLRRLSRIGVSGVAIGIGMHAPPLTPELLEASDDLKIPIIEVSGGVPFIAISETVALANQDALHRRLTTHLRTYQVLGEASQQSMSTGEIIGRLEQVTGFRIWSVTRSGASLFDDIGTPPFPIPQAVVDDVLDDTSPALRYPKEIPVLEVDGPAYVLPIRVQRQPVGVLITRTGGRQEPDLLSMHHIVTILSHLAGDLLKQREQARREGSERLARMLHESEQQRNHALHELFPGSDPQAQFCFAVVALNEVPHGWNDIHNYLLEHNFEHCVTRRGERGAILVRLPTGTIDTLGRVLTDNLPGSTIGVSSAAAGDTDLLVCQRQARWALRSAVATKLPLQLYVDAPAPQWLPMESSGLELISDKVLGPLFTYDASRGTDLVRTLMIFLEENRSWKATAERLFIHRQTLIGRVARIESLTGRSLSSTADVCDLWLAIRAHNILERSGTVSLDD
ncbi:PucR family transcriptional regulator [Terrabacter sp. C0L_2]|uniref:PucR family transcriptional regulator n=1 Tax=Terrabacter sp. C0L_2 TaxID=3108389 RepID=UPI002ED69A6E|nr:PucR family transcriptional regulator ligand-binding domain-containing protein [Terrabacter sp. C0L_2]